MGRFKNAKVVSRASESAFVAVLSGELPSKSMLDEFFAVVVVRSGEQYVNLASFADEVGERLKEKLASVPGANLRAIETVMNEAGEGFEQVNLELVLAVLVGAEVYLVVSGAGVVSVYRDGALGKVLESRGSMVSSKGSLKETDTLVLSSLELFERLSYAQLKGVLDMAWTYVVNGNGMGRVELVAEKLAVFVSGGTERGGMGAVIVGWEEEEEKSVERGASIVDDGAENKNKRVLGIWQKLKGRGIRIRGRRGWSRRKIGVVVVAAIVLVLTISLGFSSWRAGIREREEAVNAVLVPANDLIEQARVESSVNRLRAKSMLNEARGLIESQVGEFREGSRERQELEEKLREIEERLVAVSGEEQVEVGVFVDGGLTREGFFGEKLALDLEEERLLVMDATRGVVLMVDTESKEVEVVGGGENLAGARLLALAGDNGWVFGSRGVVNLDLGGESEVVIETQEEWEEVVSLGAFGSNVYLLDKSLGEIWKYSSPVAGEENVRSRWLAPGVTPSFSQVVEMMIDGDIWVLDSDGGVRRYTQGVGEQIELVGLDKPVGSAQAIWVYEEKIYLLDRGNSRVLVFSVEGEYEKQYVNGELNKATDMVVLPGKILVQVGARVLEIRI